MGMDRSRGLCSLRVKSVPALNLFNFALLKSILFASIPSLSWIRPLELAGDNDCCDLALIAFALKNYMPRNM